MEEEDNKKITNVIEKFRAMPTRKKAQYLIVILLAAVIVAVYISVVMPPADAAIDSSDFESRCSKVLSGIDGAGKVNVVINEDMNTAVIVAEGADRISTKIKLTKAAKTLLGVSAQNIEVLEMYKEE